MHVNDTERNRVARSIQIAQDAAALRALNEDAGEGCDYAAGLSRLRHAAVEQGGDTWEQACVRFPDAVPT